MLVEAGSKRERGAWLDCFPCLFGEYCYTWETGTITTLYQYKIWTGRSFNILYCGWEMFMLFVHVPRPVSSEGSLLYGRCFSVWTLHLREGSRSLILSSNASSGPLILNKRRFVYMFLWAHTFETLFSTIIDHFYITLFIAHFSGEAVPCLSFFLERKLHSDDSWNYQESAAVFPKVFQTLMTYCFIMLKGALGNFVYVKGQYEGETHHL